MSIALDRVTQALLSHGCAQRGRDWTCPSHADNDPSLSVTESETGVIIHCHAGCSAETITSALRLTMSDLFNETFKPERAIVLTYDYTDEAGVLKYQVVRYSPKDFRQRVPDGRGGYRWSLSGIRRVIYRLPEVITAVASGKRVFVVEGEKDADAFYERGEVATCNSGGAGKWRDEYAHWFADAHVIIVADKDEPGRKHARDVGVSIEQTAMTVRVAEPKVGKDSYDHFAAGLTADEFIDAIEASDVGEVEEELPVDSNPMWLKLLATNDIDSIPPPTYLIDKFLVADALTVVYGLPGACKSFLTIDWALSIGNKVPWFGHEVIEGEVLYLVAEGLAGIGIRKLAWQSEREVIIPRGVRWYPEPVNLLEPRATGHLLEVVDTLQPLMVVVDTLARSMPGVDENSSGPMSQVVEVCESMRRATKAAIVLVHHTGKDGATLRGHSSLEGAIQTAVKVTNTEGAINVSAEKQKDDEEVAINLRLRKVLNSAVLYPETLGADRGDVMSEIGLLKIIGETCGPEGISSSALLRMSGLPERTFYRAIKGLARRGRVSNLGTDRQPRWAFSVSENETEK